ncbi:helix-turn-helix domain-containing protein [Streptomyces sp. DT18]
MNTEHTPSAACYRHGCRRDECRGAYRRYRKALELDRLRGHHHTVGAAQVRVHIQRLQALGWTNKQIGQAAGISRSAVSAILRKRTEVTTATARSIFEIRLRRAPTTAGDWTDPTGSQRRLRALAALGYNLIDLAPQLNLNASWLYKVARGSAQHIAGADALRIAALYRRLVRTPPPVGASAERIRTRAARLGWHGPTAWGSDIDDPRCEPEVDDTEPRGIRERVDETEVARLLADGLSDDEIAAELGCHPRTISRARDRLRVAEEVAA